MRTRPALTKARHDRRSRRGVLLRVSRWTAGSITVGLVAFWVSSARTSAGAVNDSTNAATTDNSASATPTPTTARGLYNAGTEKLAQGELDDAEMLLRASLGRQNEFVQPRALYNLGHVRFGQGVDELKKALSPAAASSLGSAMENAGNRAVELAESALEGTNVQKLVLAYLNGRGALREMHAATEAVRRAMESYGGTLLRWRLALDDFRSSAELNPTDTNSVHNAEYVERAIAKLVDSLRQMQQNAAAAGNQSGRLKQLMKQLKGRIPNGMIPPGAGGDEDDNAPPMEALRGLKEAPSQGGGEIKLTLSPEEAGQLLDGFRLGGDRRLPMGMSDTAQPINRSGRTW